MRLRPLRQWICDSCHEVIDEPEQGCLEWNRGQTGATCIGFRIVHNVPTCEYEIGEMDVPEWIELGKLLGIEGHARLLDMLQWMPVDSTSELYDIVRRLQLPYYEEARLYLDAAGISLGVQPGHSQFTPDRLKEIIKSSGHVAPISVYEFRRPEERYWIASESERLAWVLLRDYTGIQIDNADFSVERWHTFDHLVFPEWQQTIEVHEYLDTKPFPHVIGYLRNGKSVVLPT